MAQANNEDRKGLIQKLADRFSIADGGMLYDALKQTAFSTGNNNAPPTDAQMMALLVVADQHGLNPWCREIYAFPDKKGGIVPVVGVDGWSRIANEHPEFDGVEFSMSENLIQQDEQAKMCPEWMECTVYRKDRSHAITIREYLDEVYKPAVQKQGRNGPYLISGPWQTHTKRFFRHKTLIQALRLAFGFSGIFDPDEAQRIRDQEERNMGKADVVEETTQQVALPEPQPSSGQPVLIEQQPQESFSQINGFQANQVLVDSASNLVGRAIETGAWDTCDQYARQTWSGDEQTYVLEQLSQAQTVAA